MKKSRRVGAAADQAQADATAAGDAAAAAQSAANSLADRVTSAETSITQNANAILSLATKVEQDADRRQELRSGFDGSRRYPQKRWSAVTNCLRTGRWVKPIPCLLRLPETAEPLQHTVIMDMR